MKWLLSPPCAGRMTISRFTATMLVALACLFSSLLVRAKAEDRPPQPSTTRYTNYTRLTLSLPKAFRNERDITLHLGVHDGEVLQAWGEFEG